MVVTINSNNIYIYNYEIFLLAEIDLHHSMEALAAVINYLEVCPINYLLLKWVCF